MYNFTQEQVFISFIIIGIIIGMLLDIFRVFRKSFKTHDNITFLEDAIFLIISGIIIIFSTIKLNNGEIRAFLFFGIFLGITSYLLTISHLYVIILYTFVNLCKKILKIPIFCLKKLQKCVVNVTKKDF